MRRTFSRSRRAATEPIVPPKEEIAPKEEPADVITSPYFPQAVAIKKEEGTEAEAEEPQVPVKRGKRKHIKIEEPDEKPDLIPVKEEKPSTITAANRKGAAFKESPPEWERIFHLIQEQRKGIVAAVDKFGAEVLSEKDSLDPKVSRYATLLSLMLSSQTRDEITFKAMQQLKAHGMTVDNILNTPEATLAQLIYPVGFYNTKAKNILKATQILKDKYDGDIPSTLEGLLDLPGVGPKMAHLAMLIAWDKPTGIGVDTHVHRICNRLRWVKTDLPEKTRVALEQWLPEEYWVTINKVFVGFGQSICQPVNPKCDECSVSEYCPSAFKETTRGKGGQPKLKRSKTS